MGGGIIVNGDGIRDIDSVTDRYQESQLSVFSALKGVTDRLKEYSKTRNPETLSSVLWYCSDAGRRCIKGNYYQGSFNEMLRGIERDLTASKGVDEILSAGERISTELYYLHKKSVGGDIGKVTFDKGSTETFPIICTDFQEDADIILQKSKNRIGAIKEELEKHRECATPGFIGVTEGGELRTLGRGGTDDSAIYYAYALGSGEVNLWKETEGLRTADPKKVLKTRLIDYASYSEINNMSKFGAKIVQHKSSKLAQETGVIIRIPYIKNPEIATVVDGDEKKEKHLVKYVGGSDNSFLIESDFEDILKIRELCKEQNLKQDFHMIHSNYHFARSLVLNSKNSFNGGKKVGVVALVGDNLKSTTGVLERATKVAVKEGINIEDYGSGGGRESYMFFVCSKGLTDNLIRILHEDFIESDISWSS